MTQDQFMGVLRHLLSALGAFVVAKGIADEDTVVQASGAIGTLVAIGWSMIEKLKR